MTRTAGHQFFQKVSLWCNGPRATAASHDQLREPAIGPIHALRPGGRTTTIAPSFTRFTRSMMSSLVMRMQPDEMAWPIYSGWLVPWIWYRVSLLPS